MRREERAALAAIIASGIMTRNNPGTVSGVVQQALAVADTILERTEADDKTADRPVHHPV